MESAPADAGVVSIYYSGLYCHVLLFYLFCVDLFIYLNLAFRTHVSSCIRDGVVIPNPD
jgi:hypothetical protein